MHFQRQCLFRFYSSTSSALMLEDNVFDESSKSHYTNFVINRPAPHVPATRRELFPLVSRVFKSLSWSVAREGLRVGLRVMGFLIQSIALGSSFTRLLWRGCVWKCGLCLEILLASVMRLNMIH